MTFVVLDLKRINKTDHSSISFSIEVLKAAEQGWFMVSAANHLFGESLCSWPWPLTSSVRWWLWDVCLRGRFKSDGMLCLHLWIFFYWILIQSLFLLFQSKWLVLSVLWTKYRFKPVVGKKWDFCLGILMSATEEVFSKASHLCCQQSCLLSFYKSCSALSTHFFWNHMIRICWFLHWSNTVALYNKPLCFLSEVFRSAIRPRVTAAWQLTLRLSTIITSSHCSPGIDAWK